MQDDFDFFKCKFAPIVNLINIFLPGQNGFLEEVSIHEKDLSDDIKDRLCLINVEKAYFEEITLKNIEMKKEIIFKSSVI